jgi:hypothetical protein
MQCHAMEQVQLSLCLIKPYAIKTCGGADAYKAPCILNFHSYDTVTHPICGCVGPQPF